MRRDEAGYRLAAAAKADIAQIEDAAAPGTAGTVRAIHRCLEATQIKTKYAVCSVCGPDVAIRRFDFPPLSYDEVPNAVLFEADQVCPFDVGQSVVDYQLIAPTAADSAGPQTPKQPNKTCGVFVAATADIVSQKIRFVKSASRNCVLMDVDGLALLNCFMGCEQIQPGKAVAIINVGSSFTNLAILRAGVLPFVRDLCYAGDDIVERIATDRQVSRRAVHAILSRSNEVDSPQIEGLSDSLKKACEKLISDVVETLRYYIAQEGTPIDGIFICGGFAQVDGFVDLLADQLPARVILWNPLAKIRRDSDSRGIDVIEENGPVLALAAGLAMRTL